MKNRFATGFTLVEMLAVIVIIIIIAAFTAPVLNSVLKGSHLNQSQEMIVGGLNLARQTALTKNRKVEVRFYRYGDPGIPGESASNPASGRYRAFQLFEYADDGTSKQVSRIQRLPNSVIIDSGQTLSPLLDASRTKTWTSGDIKPTLPIGSNYDTRAFQFRPDGTTDLGGSSTNRFFTLHNLNESDNRTDLPANNVVVSVDPVNGNIRSYRP